MTLHVLHVIGGGDTGGAMSHLLPLVAALRRAGADAHLLCLGEGGLEEEARRRAVPVEVLPMGHAWDPGILRPLRRALAAGPVTGVPWDVVHTHGMRANLPVRLVSGVLRRRPCLFTTVHSDLRLDYRSPALARLYQLIDRGTIPLVDGVICVSDSLRTLLLERGYPAGRLVTVRSGIELRDALAPAASPPAGPAAAVASPPTAEPPGGSRRPRVGTVARLVPVKDVALVLEVADRLRRTVPQVEVVVVGDGPERARLEAQASAAGLGETVRFTGRQAGIDSILRGFDVYLVTSVFEGGVSMSVLEAMAAGLPVVTTAAGGVAEVVEDGVTGTVVSRDQERGALAAELADRVAGLLADREMRERWGEAGARRVRERFRVEQTAAATVRLYERCLGGC